MKTIKILLVGLAVAVWMPLSAQDNSDQKADNVPQQVKTKFSHEYPQTLDTEWKMVGDSYVVEFTTAEDGNKRVWYDKSGEKQSEERRLDIEKDLPSAVKDAINTRYDSFYLKDVSEIKKDGNITYRVKLDNNGEVSDVILNSEGNEVK